MYKIAAIIGGVLLLAGVALAGTVTSLGTTTTTPSISSLPAVSTTATTATATTARQDDCGRENEARGRANEPGEDLRGLERARHDLLRRAVSAQRVDGDPRQLRRRLRCRLEDVRASLVRPSGMTERVTECSRPSPYGEGVRSGSISRPPYVLQFGHMRCGCFGRPHCGQVFTRGASSRCVARRLSRRDLEVFFFGTAIGGRV